MQPPDPRYPGPVLRTTADYAWRLILVGIVGYYAIRLLSTLATAVVPVMGALLFTALLHPVQVRMRRRHVPRWLATLLCVLAAFVIVGGVMTLVVTRAIDQAPQLGDEINRLIPDVKNWLIKGPLHVDQAQVDSLSATLSNSVSKNSASIASTAISTGRTAFDVLTGAVLAVFTTIFFLYDGEGIWQFLLKALPSPARPRADAAGRAAWQTLGHYMRGTLIIAFFHGVVIGSALWIMGVPLVLPLALIVALGSFIPIVGAVVAGALAVVVALLADGLGAGLVILVVLVTNDQVEAHLLQPFVVGRYVRIHPLAIVLSLAVGGLLFGIFGAIVAVPVVGCANSAVRAALRTVEPEEPMDPERTDATEP